MRTIYLIFLLSLFVCNIQAATFDIVCNVDGADCYIDGKNIGTIFDNHLYYTLNFDSDSLKLLEVKTQNGSAETILHDTWDDYEIKRIVLYIDDGIHPPMGTLNIYTDPAGAKVYFQEDYLGKGEFKEVGETGEDNPYVLTTYQGYHRIKVYLNGYNAITDRIYVYGDDEFDNCYYLESGELTPVFTAEPTPTQIPTPTPEIIIQEKEVLKEVTKTAIKEVPVIPSPLMLLIGCVCGAVAMYVLNNREKIALKRKNK